MKPSLKRIIKAYLEEEENKKESFTQTKRTPSPYHEPLNKNMPNYPYYQEQEMTDTKFDHLQAPHGDKDLSDKRNDLDKMFVYPEQEWQNADWAYGDYLSPYQNEIQQQFNRTENSPINLYDPMRGASELEPINDLTLDKNGSIDFFLDTPNGYQKIASDDMGNFFKFSEDGLIHKSKKDLWKMYKDKDGNIFISRQFEDGILSDEE